jgi:hypothetical protein
MPSAYKTSGGQREANMTKKWVTISLVLFVTTGLFGQYVLESIKGFRKQNNPTDIINKLIDGTRKKNPDTALPQTDAPTKTYTFDEFKVIRDKMLFSETRNPVVPPETLPPDKPVQEVVQPLNPKPILVGTLLSETRPLAFIVDPGSAQASAPRGDPGLPPGVPPEMVGRGSRDPGGAPVAVPVASRRARTMKIGDTYHGYTLTKITAENVTLSSFTRTEIIPLHEGSKVATKGKTQIAVTKLVTIGVSTPSTGTGTTGRTPTTSAPGQVAAMNPQNPTPGGGGPGGGGVGGGRGGMPQPDTSQPGRGLPFNVVGSTPTGGTVITTPFGQVTR